MAQKVSVLLVDDIDGSEAAETIPFGFDGAQYEIDLNREHAQELREQLTRYAQAARKVTASVGRPSRTRTTAANGSSNKKIRAWAKERGLHVNNRGRISGDIIARYEAETGK